MVKLKPARDEGDEGTQGMRRYLPGAWLSAHIEDLGNYISKYFCAQKLIDVHFPDNNLLGVLMHLDHSSGMRREWPYHIYDYDGTHHRIELKAGEMIIFEGCRYGYTLNRHE